MKVLTYQNKGLLILFSFATMASAMQDSSMAADVLQEGVQQTQTLMQSNVPQRVSGWRQFGRALSYCSAQLGRAAFSATNLAAVGSWYTARFLARPDMLKVEAAMAGVGATYGLAKSVLNRARLYEKADKHGLYKMPSSWGWFLWAVSKNNNGNHEASSGKIKIYNWRLKALTFGEQRTVFPTPSTIKYPGGRIPRQQLTHQEKADLRQFRNSIAEELLLDSGILYVQGNQTAASDPRNRILNIIDAGLRELTIILDELKTYACFPSKRYDRIGIEKIINDCCLKYVQDLPAGQDDGISDEQKAADMRKVFNFNELSYEQEQSLDRLVKNAIKTKLVHWMTLRLNFGLAATIYWEALKRLKRLEALRGIVDEYYGRRIIY